jgi:hypothetical protein
MGDRSNLRLTPMRSLVPIKTKFTREKLPFPPSLDLLDATIWKGQIDDF